MLTNGGNSNLEARQGDGEEDGDAAAPIGLGDVACKSRLWLSKIRERERDLESRFQS